MESLPHELVASIEQVLRIGDVAKLDELLAENTDATQAILDMALFVAASNSNAKFVGHTLAKGANPNQEQRKGRRGRSSPLLAVITSGNPNPDILQRLLDANSDQVAWADPNMEDENKNTALLTSCLRSFSACVEVLINAGADPNHKNDQGNTAMHMVGARPGRFEGSRIVYLLLGHNGDMFAQNNQGETPLLRTVRQGNLDAVRCLLDKIKGCPDAAQKASLPSIKGYTPLHEAAIWGKEELVKLLLDSGLFDVNAQDRDGNTALYLAGDRKLGAPLLNEDPLGKVHVLLDHGADANLKNAQGNTVCHLPHVSQEFLEIIAAKGKPDLFAKNHAGQTPLERQLMAGRIFNVLLILKHIGDLNKVDEPIFAVTDSDGNSLLHWLSEVDEVELFRTVLPKFAANTAGLSLANGQGQTPVDIAIRHQSLGILEYITLDLGASIDTARVLSLRNDAGETVLHRAVRLGNLSMVRRLLDVGVDVNVETVEGDEFSDGGQPIHVAAINGNVNALTLLVESGADLNSTKSPSEDTPLHLAVRFSRIDAVKALLELGAKTHIENAGGDDAVAEAKLRSDWPILALLENSSQ